MYSFIYFMFLDYIFLLWFALDLRNAENVFYWYFFLALLIFWGQTFKSCVTQRKLLTSLSLGLLGKMGLAVWWRSRIYTKVLSVAAPLIITQAGTALPARARDVQSPLWSNGVALHLGQRKVCSLQTAWSYHGKNVAFAAQTWAQILAISICSLSDLEYLINIWIPFSPSRKWISNTHWIGDNTRRALSGWTDSC